MQLVGIKVHHKIYGPGTIIEQGDKTITVCFAEKDARFVYPDPNTFTKYLTADDPSLQVVLSNESVALPNEKRNLVQKPIAQTVESNHEQNWRGEQYRQEKARVRKGLGRTWRIGSDSVFSTVVWVILSILFFMNIAILILPPKRDKQQQNKADTYVIATSKPTTAPRMTPKATTSPRMTPRPTSAPKATVKPTSTPKPFNHHNIQMESVESSSLAKVGYDEFYQVLKVEFVTSGDRYIYTMMFLKALT